MSAPAPMRRLPRMLLVAAGMVSLAIGIAGVFVPLLPTTPFLLVAAAAFARGSPRLHAWILGHRVLGPPIRAYVERRGIRLPVKIGVIALLWVSIGVSAVFLVKSPAVRVGLGVVAAAVSWHIASFRTLPGFRTARPARCRSRCRSSPRSPASHRSARRGT